MKPSGASPRQHYSQRDRVRSRKHWWRRTPWRNERIGPQLIMADNWEDDAATAPAGRNDTLRNQLKRINLSEKTLKMFEADEVDLQLLLDLDAESLAEVEFQAGERERLVEWLKAIKALKKRCAELDKAIP